MRQIIEARGYQARCYEVDWLRVIAFLILIFYHIGMFYVADWGWHVKSRYQSEALQKIMLLLNQWRMPLVFFISGFALCMVESKISSVRLLKLRLVRIFIPLVIGMNFIVPPQVYYEAVQNSDLSISYWAFFLEYLSFQSELLPDMQSKELGLMTWNHLWYLAYLWHYTLVYLLLRRILIRIGNVIESKQANLIVVLIVPVIVLTSFGLWLKPIFPTNNGLIDDWYNHALYFSVLCFGYFAAKSQSIWRYIRTKRRLWLLGALIGYSGILVLSGDSVNHQYPRAAAQIWVYTNLWLWVLTVVGFASHYLNKPSASLVYLNDAILPWYILHQTVIIVLAMQLSKLKLGGAMESSLLVIGTFAICAAFYAGIRRFKLTRFIFGMKQRRP